NKIFDDMIDFAKYAFNKSHAAAYGVLAYETAYLKAHYPVEFMAALITSVMGNTDKVVEYIRECNSLKIEVLKPDINRSFTKFSVENKSIRFGLAAVKNVGVNVLNNIIEERKVGGEFKDFSEFCKRLDSKDANKRIIESLIKCGAFDEMGDNRASLLLGYEKLLESISMDRKKNLAGQVSLFDGFAMDDSISDNIQNMHNLPNVKELEEKEKLYLEKEVLGMYVSGHPLSQYKDELKKRTTINNADLNEIKDDYISYLNLNEKEVTMGGIVVNKTIRTTKRNDLMAIIELEDLYGVIEVIVFPQVLQKYNTIIQEDKIIYIEGRLSIKEDENAKLIAREIIDMNSSLNQNKPSLYLKINSIEDKELVNNLISIVTKYTGDEDIYIYAENIKQMYKWNHIKVNINENLINELNNILPKSSIKVKI
ncbi:MAG: OB-fold nucleic acid binding domain-containing protein, partial [Paraclostridium sp.]